MIDAVYRAEPGHDALHRQPRKPRQNGKENPPTVAGRDNPPATGEGEPHDAVKRLLDVYG